MATIDTVTGSGEAPAAEPETTASILPPVAAQVMAPVNPQTAAAQRSMTVVVTVFGAIITALLGGMFLFTISAICGHWVQRAGTSTRSGSNAWKFAIWPASCSSRASICRQQLHLAAQDRSG